MVLEERSIGTLKCQKDHVGSRANKASNIAGGKDGKTEVILLWAQYEKAGSLEKTVILGKIKDSRKRGRQDMRWIFTP